MGNLIAKEKEIVVPGDVLAEGMDYIPGFNTYRQGEKIYAGKLGLLLVEGRAVKLIPLSGKYNPKVGDTVICKVIDITMSGWRVETNSAYSAMLSFKETSEYIAKGADLTQYLNFGDYIVSKIIQVTTQKLIDVSVKGPGLRKLSPGRILTVNPYKVPRIIGKKGSMVSMIKDATGTKIVVGQNGLIWLSGDDPLREMIAVKAIEKIEAEAHTSGLTEKIKEYIDTELKSLKGE